MNANSKIQQVQEKLFQLQRLQQGAMDFFNYLNSPELLNALEEMTPEHRERLFPPMETLSLFLTQALSPDRSCQNIVNQAATARIFRGLPVCSTCTSAYCRARKRLPINMIKTLTRLTGQYLKQHTPESWLWRGRAVRIIDGTTTTLPDTPANQEKYPQQARQAPGLGFPICRIVGITCWATGALLDAAIGAYKGAGTGEPTLLRQLLGNIDSGDILLGDALYGSFFTLAQCLNQGVDVVFEQHGARKLKTDFRRGQRLGSKDHITRLKRPKKRPDWMTEEAYQSYPEELLIREVYVGRKILTTTLNDPKAYPKSELKQLYKSRWQVELDIRNIKTVLGMETLSCKTPEMAEKEIWVYFLAYNLIRTLMAQSAKLSHILPRQLSFKHTLQLWLAWGNHARNTGHSSCIDNFFELTAENTVGNRPGRMEPRAVKRRPKPYPLLMETRSKAKENILKHGHPPKQRGKNRSAS